MTRKFPVSLSIPGGRNDAPKSATVRLPLNLGVKVKRWRLHIENLNPSIGTDGGARTGAVDMGDLYIGTNRWNGGLTNTRRVTSIPNIPAGQTGTVTSWITGGLDGGIAFSFDYSADAAPQCTFGGGWVRANARDAGTISNTGMKKTTVIPFHVWIGVEVEDDVPAVAILGSSSAAGYGGDTQLYDSPLSQLCRAHGAIPVHYAIPGDTLKGWLDPNAYKWRPFPGTDRPDALLMWLGSNDVFSGASLDDMKSRFNTVVGLAAQKITGTIDAGTIAPRTSATGNVETVRRQFNDWLRTLPSPVRHVYETGKAVSDDDETIRPAMNFDGTHPNTSGYKATAQSLAGLIPGRSQPVTTARQSMTVTPVASPTPAKVDDPAPAVATPTGDAPQSTTLDQKALGELDSRVDAVDQITVSVHADHPLHGIDMFTVGDPALVTVAGWLAVPDGTHRTRIIKASGDLSNTVKLDFQTDSWI